MNETARQAAEQRYTDDKRKQKELQQATVRVLDEQVRPSLYSSLTYT